MTPERSHRHRRRGGVVQCSCGAGEPTIQRISWECSKYAVQRTPVISHVLSDLCFGSSQHAHSPRRHHHRTDERIVAVWQAHITEWTEEAEAAFVARDAPHRDRSEAQALPGIVSNAARSSAPDAPGSPVQAVILQDQLLPVPRNGHIIKLLDAGGAFCQRCGKSTARMKHLKLKILSKACKFQHLPPEK